MRVGSRFAVVECRLIKTRTQSFYKARIIEKVYNTRKSYSQWETAVYNEVYIYDTSFPIEPAKFDKPSNANDPYSFSKISNPETSVFRAMEFYFERLAVWDGNRRSYNQDGTQKHIYLLYISKLAKGNSQWRSDDNKYNILIKKYNEQKRELKKQRHKVTTLGTSYQKKLDKKDAEVKEQKKEIKKQLRELNKERKRVIDTRKKLQEDDQTFVLKIATEKRKVTNLTKQVKDLTKQLERAQNKLDEQKSQVKKIKKIKKQQIIEDSPDYEMLFDDM